MRVLHSSEVHHIGGGDDMLYTALLMQLPPEQQDKEFKGLIVGHCSVLGAMVSGGASAGLVSLATQSSTFIIGGGIIGAVGGGVLTYSYLASLMGFK